MGTKMSAMPNIAIPRSKFKQAFNHATSFRHGKIIPIDCFEVIPGDTISLNLASLIRMSNPIVPLFSNIKCRIDAFFVPLRLIWDDAEKFYGDPSNHNKIQTILPVDFEETLIPAYSSLDEYFPDDGSYCFEAVSHYLGKPVYDSSSAAGTAFNNAVENGKIHISCLKERAYYEIYNEYYRPSALSLPYLINKGNTDTAVVCVDAEGNSLGYNAPVQTCFKSYDYFTANTLMPQYGEEIEIPFSNKYASVEVAAIEAIDGETIIPSFRVPDIPGVDSRIAVSDALYLNTVVDDSLEPLLSEGDPIYGSMRARLPNGIAAINTIRYCFQLQKFLERSNYGNLFYQQLNAHYGVTSPDGRLQRPDHLGKAEFYISVNQVLSTAGAEYSDSSKLGQPGAVSVTGNNSYLFTASFTEPGYVMILLETKLERDYSSGILREDLKRNRLEFYTPEFANLGDQGTKRIELQLFCGKDANNRVVCNTEREIFGYQEHWAEYRYRKNLITGDLSPDLVITTDEASMPFWTAGDSFNDVSSSYDNGAVKVKLNDAFLKEDRLSLSRCLVTGVNGPDYIADFHFSYVSTRELPLYSIPGLIDHFGAL